MIYAKYTYPRDWTPAAQDALEKIKLAYSNAPILIAPDWSRPFHVHTDASNIAVGVMLAQNINGKNDQLVAYASRLVNQAERNYSTTEREALTMINAVKKFRHYLLGNKFGYMVDHHSLSYLVNQPLVTGRVARWIMILLEYDFEMVHVPGKRHIIADYLSKDSKATKEGIDDSFNEPYLQAASLTLDSPEDWRSNIILYMTTGTVPTGYTGTKRISFVSTMLPYTVIQGQLY